MANVYYDPQKFGLKTIGEIQWGEPDYSFNLTVVWERESDGAFLMGEDAGCSCPSPFEDQSTGDLIEVNLDGLKVALEGRNGNGSDRYYPDQSVDIAELLERCHSAGLR